MQVSYSNIKAIPNKKNKTFTIKTYFKGKISAKYRTVKFSKDEFLENENNTFKDWQNFLKTSEYTLIKNY